MAMSLNCFKTLYIFLGFYKCRIGSEDKNLEMLEKAYIEAINKLVDEDKTKSINEFLDIVEQTIISKSSDNAINALKAEIECFSE